MGSVSSQGQAGIAFPCAGADTTHYALGWLETKL